MYYEINVAKRTDLKESSSYRHFFATSPRSCTTLDQTKIVLKELVEKFPEPEYNISINYYPESGEIYNVWDILPDETPNLSPNKMVEMLDIPKIKRQISDCKETEIVIICNNWSINRPKYTEDEALDGLQEADWDNFEELLGFPIEINQYDDLIVDPYGIVD